MRRPADRRSAEAFAVDLAGTYPDRSPGSAGALGAESWFSDQMQRYGYMVASPANKCPTSEFRTERFFATVAGVGRLPFVNQFAIAHGVSTDTIVVMAHRDDAGTGPGANDNASGTGALMELARAYVNPACRAVQPAHTIVFLSSDGGIYGAVGARHFVRAYPERILAVVNLDALAGDGPPRLEIGGDTPRTPSGTLVETAAARIFDQTGGSPGRTSFFGQLVDLVKRLGQQRLHPPELVSLLLVQAALGGREVVRILRHARKPGQRAVIGQRAGHAQGQLDELLI